jgi:hypothetical protein
VVIWRRETENGAIFVVQMQTDDVDDEKKEQRTIILTSYTVLVKQ